MGFIMAILCGVGVYILAGIFNLLPLVEQNMSLLIAVSLLVGVRIIANILYNYPRARNQVKIFETINLSKLLLESLLLAVVFWWFQSIPLALWSLVGISTVFSAVLAVIYFPRDLHLPNVFSFRQYLEYGIPMMPKVMGARLLSNADKYLLTVLISPTAVAVYAVSYSIAKLLQNFTSPLNSTLYPAVSAAWEDGEFVRLGELYTQIFRGYTLIGVPAVAGVSILAEPLLTLISTERIAEQGVYILPWLAVTFYVRGYDNPLTYVLNAAEENIKLAKIVITASVMNILLNIILIPILGIFGAVVATLVSQLLVAGYIYANVKSKIDIQLPGRSIVRSVLATLLMAVILIFQPFVLSSIQKVILFPLIGVFVYLLTLFLIGEFSTREISIAISFLRNESSD
jgi:O-antigen/teichoic acid export membrane protein